ncbi:MAG: hypothetical protein RMN25_08365 [Anaerolineae bacterium]|nr:hypothetical protein [Thermoflexales bacterium]MDW8407787.1 hypothetical protein [Anaerolineae bacterium]
MIHRQTQKPEYWSTFQLTPGDVDYLSNLLLEAAEPKSASELALALIRYRVEAENAMLRRNTAGQIIYQPKKKYAIGEELTFPALGFETGRVISSRPGQNPEAKGFDVILVEMAGGVRREFAANYTLPHRLNDDDFVSSLSNNQETASPEQLYELYGEHVVRALNAALEKHPDFLRVADDWFLRALMAEVNVGHLNLAEAVLDMANGGPLTASAILGELGLPPDVAANLQEIALNTALARDERFDDVSLTDEPSWFLRRLEPPEVRAMPPALRPAKYTGPPVVVNDELKTLAYALDDELEMSGDVEEHRSSAQVVLTFPHRLAGTLGWSRRLAAVLPKVNKPRVPVTFRDRANGREFLVWLVRDGRYIFGLGDWYEANDLPAGAHIEISSGPADNIFIIDCKRHRPKREWVRFATQRDGHLRLETAQRAVGCEFDELMSVFCDQISSLATLRGEHPRDVVQAVREAFPEIAKLSPQGNVHASTLYAVVNVITRAAPMDVFAALSANPAYHSVGDNYWHLSETR